MRKRDWMVLGLALALAVAAAIGVLRGTVLETGAWGLSFREPGTSPVGNAGVDQLGLARTLQQSPGGFLPGGVLQAGRALFCGFRKCAVRLV